MATQTPDDIRLILFPDPRLRRVSQPIETFDDALRQLAERMLEIMRENKGVGLAAPQVGRNVRLFVTNPTGEPGADRVYVNPQISDVQGEEEAEEGCLSLPEIHANIWRGKSVRMNAQDLQGQPFEQIETGFVPRIWQHELDHLNGTLILDRMGPGAKLMVRKKLRELEDRYATEHPQIKPKVKKKHR